MSEFARQRELARAERYRQKQRRAKRGRRAGEGGRAPEFDESGYPVTRGNSSFVRRVARLLKPL